MPTGKVKWFDVEKGFGFLARDDGGDVFVHTSSLPTGVESLEPGQRVEFGVAEGKRGEQALSVRVLEAAPTMPGVGGGSGPARREPEELHGMIEDMIKLLDTVQHDYRRGKHPERKSAKKIAEVLHAVAREIEA
ncbi:MAG TPA: cold shock domain-containing protein [Mycobacteriales bacterium]|nr:cold shock domain-containing protein [Mycobacteriales bacterium]